MKTFRFSLVTNALAVVALSFAYAGSTARADLILTIADTGGGGNPTLVIDNNGVMGTFTLSTTGVRAYNFKIDGQVFSGNTGPATGGNPKTATGHFTTTANSLTFVTSTSPLVAFGDFSINLTSSQSLSPSGSSITNTSTEIGAVSGSSGNTLTFATQSVFTQPSTPSVVLKSSLYTNSVSNPDPNATGIFSSTIGTATATTAAVTNSTHNDVSHPATASTYALGGASYTVSNLLTVHGLNFTPGTKDTVSFTDTTAVLPTPEPGTYVLALTAIPAAFMFLRRRKVQA